MTAHIFNKIMLKARNSYCETAFYQLIVADCTHFSQLQFQWYVGSFMSMGHSGNIYTMAINKHNKPGLVLFPLESWLLYIY